MTLHALHRWISKEGLKEMKDGFMPGVFEKKEFSKASIHYDVPVTITAIVPIERKRELTEQQVREAIEEMQQMYGYNCNSHVIEKLFGVEK